MEDISRLSELISVETFIDILNCEVQPSENPTVEKILLAGVNFGSIEIFNKLKLRH